MTQADCEGFVALFSTLTDAETAAHHLTNLMGYYDRRSLDDPEFYTSAAMKVFMSYPAPLVRDLCDPVEGIASRSKYFPSVADLSRELRTMKDKIDKEVSLAMHRLYMAERQRKAAEALNVPQPSVEERVEQVQRLLKTRKMEDDQG